MGLGVKLLLLSPAFFFWGGGGRVSFRGCEGGRGASQLPGLRREGGGESALELCVRLSSSSFAGNGGESASGGAKGGMGARRSPG